MIRAIAVSELVPRTQLPTSGLEVSRISLGLGHLHHIRLSRDRVRLIDAARDLGVTHFDTARLYGDGLTERSLGRAVHHCRSRVTITTKFGLLATDWMGAIGWARQPFWAARTALLKVGAISWPRRSYTVSTMRENLHLSLRLLQTDYVDVLSIHDPEVTEVEGNDSLCDALAAEKRAGNVRLIGIAGVHAQSIALAYPDVFDVVQTAESVWNGESPIPDFTYGAISSAGARVRGMSTSEDGARTALAKALSRRKNGSVLVGTTKIDHLRAAAQVASSEP